MNLTRCPAFYGIALPVWLLRCPPAGSHSGPWPAGSGWLSPEAPRSSPGPECRQPAGSGSEWHGTEGRDTSPHCIKPTAAPHCLWNSAAMPFSNSRWGREGGGKWGLTPGSASKSPGDLFLKNWSVQATPEPWGSIFSWDWESGMLESFQEVLMHPQCLSLEWHRSHGVVVGGGFGKGGCC